MILIWSPYLKGLTQLWKSRRIYPKYMPKCSVGSTDHVCKFYSKILRNVEDIDVWNFRQERFMLRHLRQWSKNFGFDSALSHNSGAANTILFTIQTFNEHSRMAKLSQPYLRGDMRWNVTSLQIQLGLIILDACQLWSRIFYQRGNWGCFDRYCDISLTST